jgi:UPF0755 protein
MRAFKLLLLLIVLVAAVAGWWYWRDYRAFADTPLHIARGERALDVGFGTPFNRIVGELRKRKLTMAPAVYWRVLAWEMRVSDGLHAGEYELSYGLTPRTLLDRMARGLVIQHRFTIVEGWTFKQLRAALAQAESITHDTNALSDADVMTKLDAADVHPEGRFLPETYAYTKGASDLDILRRSRLAMSAALKEAWDKRQPDLPLKSADEALVLASIVERETGRADERPRIAGVFIRRLKIGMRLQTDPTVIYGLGSAFNGNLTRRHLDTDGPYNTYQRAGLTPTPIALPGKAALAAATQPADGNELYFVARGDGSHEFTATLDAHNAAVSRWQLRR